MTETQLAPCPFCGGSEIYAKENNTHFCGDCKARGPFGYLDHNPTGADDWNARARTSLETELLAALKEAVVWDSQDSEGVDAVWLNQAEAVIAKAEAKQ